VTYWKVNCMEGSYPGLWQTWFLQQTVAIGWPPPKYRLNEKSNDSSWNRARKVAREVKEGDKVVVQLSNYRIGRIGTVVGTRISDDGWLPTVPEDRKNPRGEMGRRIDVRWNLTVGEVSPSAIVQLPPHVRPKGGPWRNTISRLNSKVANAIEDAVRDEKNWTTLQVGFSTERALSDYIAAFPHLLEDGLRVYPRKVREFTFPNRKRSDVLLLDRENRLVIVECKQGAPKLEHLSQLRGYVRQARSVLLGGSAKKPIRAVLVHGGSRNLDADLRESAAEGPAIELVQFAVNVDFVSSL
jgi:hypothetical protein